MVAMRNLVSIGTCLLLCGPQATRKLYVQGEVSRVSSRCKKKVPPSSIPLTRKAPQRDSSTEMRQGLRR